MKSPHLASATGTMMHYIKLLFKTSGHIFTSDNIAEVESMFENIDDAITSEAKELRAEILMKMSTLLAEERKRYQRSNARFDMVSKIIGGAVASCTTEGAEGIYRDKEDMRILAEWAIRMADTVIDQINKHEEADAQNGQNMGLTSKGDYKKIDE